MRRSSVAQCGHQQPHPLQALLPGQNHRPRTPGPSDSGPLATSLGPPLPPVSTWTETFTRTRFKQPGPVSRALCRDVVGRMGWECPVPQRVSNTRKGGEETTLLIPLLSPKQLYSTPFHPKPASCLLPQRHPGAPQSPGLGGVQRALAAAERGGCLSPSSPQREEGTHPCLGHSPKPPSWPHAGEMGTPLPRPRHVPSSPSLRDHLALSPGMGSGASSKPGRQKGMEARMRSGFPRPASRAPRLRAKKDALDDATGWGRPRLYPRRARFQPRLPSRAPSRRGARDLPSGIPERKKAQ